MPQSRVRRLSRAGFALLTTVAAATAALTAGPAAAATSKADLRLKLTTTTTSAMILGDRAQVVVRAEVDNIGTAGVEDVSIAFTLPSGSSIVGDPTWQCDYSTFVCTNIYGPVSAGGSAEPLNIYFGLPLAPAGTVATIGARVSTSAAEASLSNNTDQVRTTYALAPELQLLPGPDTGVWPETDVPVEGGQLLPMFTAKNAGSGTAEKLRLVVDLPDGVTLDGSPYGEGYDPSPWKCDLSKAPVICTTGPLAPDAVSSVTIPMRAPAGTAEDRFAVHGFLTTTSAEWQKDSNNEANVRYRYAPSAPVDPADIAVTNVVLNDQEVVAGETAEVGVVVENLADNPAEDVRVRLSLGSTVRPADGGGAGNPDWNCSPGWDDQTAVWYWECRRDAVYRWEYHYLPLNVTFDAGTPPGEQAVTATVTSATADTNADNNSRRATTTYVAQGTVKGAAWYDEDRDGQRDATEPLIGYDPPVSGLTYIPEGGDPVGAPSGYVSIYGSHERSLPPGRYVVRASLRYGWEATTPNAGDDATDSDFTFVPPGPYNGGYADSAVVEVTDGGTVVLDIGVVPAA